jgi:outer membrane protein assembly factor BamD (BamD/ComL family)
LIPQVIVAALELAAQLPILQMPQARSEESVMSITGILSSNLFNAQSAQTTAQKLKQEFQQLGQDLQSGNLSAAQSDFAALQQNAPQAGAASSSAQSGNPVTHAFQQLSQDLKAGNLTAAQQDYSTIQQDFKTQAAPGQTQHPRHLRGAGSGGNSEGQPNSVTQLFSQLGQALQAGNLTLAQTAYTGLQADFQQFAQNNGVQSGASSSGGVSFSA